MWCTINVSTIDFLLFNKYNCNYILIKTRSNFLIKSISILTEDRVGEQRRVEEDT